MSDETAEIELPLTRDELLALYVLLMGAEAQLDQRQQGVLERVTESVYEVLSLEQIEQIEEYYRSL